MLNDVQSLRCLTPLTAAACRYTAAFSTPKAPICRALPRSRWTSPHNRGTQGTLLGTWAPLNPLDFFQGKTGAKSQPDFFWFIVAESSFNRSSTKWCISAIVPLPLLHTSPWPTRSGIQGGPNHLWRQGLWRKLDHLSDVTCRSLGGSIDAHPNPKFIHRHTKTTSAKPCAEENEICSPKKRVD